MTRANQDPTQVCNVVYKPYQFSWANGLIGKKGVDRQTAYKRLKPREARAWKEALEVAQQAIDGTLPDAVGSARYFTNLRTTNSHWAKGKHFIVKHGKTSFFS